MDKWHREQVTRLIELVGKDGEDRAVELWAACHDLAEFRQLLVENGLLSEEAAAKVEVEKPKAGLGV